ncbi:hypothetical protein JMJ77_0013992 [Colletotrichum scovillei]|uniref:Uncharacterized protein n=1 Tax=Colletotrichum scovillei TaxID=1209932 RepID=A0A9P7UDZ2_9PEZI|nr:hypothetical protein JMJ77_0013992 [Colletotrichum scovillei]KAG7065516.1 hypothetical protein JMJ78_0012268 [Colletotrichum scovillei]KAG7068119.1 hypothetical protein JMJ76_0007812 [Colletotrichum scovillei]
MVLRVLAAQLAHTLFPAIIDIDDENSARNAFPMTRTRLAYTFVGTEKEEQLGTTKMARFSHSDVGQSQFNLMKCSERNTPDPV